MKLEDFSSVVQLGVALHVSTAILQSVAEFAGTPLTRRIERLRRQAEIKAKDDAKYNESLESAGHLIGDLEVKKVQFFNEYKLVVLVNGGVAVSLCFLLAIIAFAAEWDCPILVGFFIVALSFAPAGVSLVLLRERWNANTSGLRERVLSLENHLLGLGG